MLIVITFAGLGLLQAGNCADNVPSAKALAVPSDPPTAVTIAYLWTGTPAVPAHDAGHEHGPALADSDLCDAHSPVVDSCVLQRQAGATTFNAVVQLPVATRAYVRAQPQRQPQRRTLPTAMVAQSSVLRT